MKNHSPLVVLCLAAAFAVPVLAADPCQGAEGRFAVAEGLLQRGEATAAESEYLAIQASHPACARAWFELGMLYDRRQQSAKAAEQFERATKLTPGNPRAWDYLALSLEPLGQFDNVERAYKKGLEVNQGPLFDAFLDYNYGRFLMKQNRLQEATAHLDRAVQLAPNTRAVYYERAKLHEKAGRYAPARADAERALALPDPAGVILDLQVYYQLTRIYTRLGEKDLALKYREMAEAAKVPISSRMRGGR
ncbi:MAG: tetratricopeptide repeat protein [Bryobacteraceae bacterium]|nr:tetratricopeptide repeat protein [Bryobacteraceae bacterium]